MLAMVFAAGLLSARLIGLAYSRWCLRRSRPGDETDIWVAPARLVRTLARDLEKQTDIFNKEVARRDEMLAEFREAYEQRAKELDDLKTDVRDAVAKTRELREELIERASESVREREMLRAQLRRDN